MKRSCAVLAIFCCACASAPPKDSPSGIGIIPDDTVRNYVATLTLVADDHCPVTTNSGRAILRCRAFETMDEERLIGVYDPITDIMMVLLHVMPDGRQRVLWQREHGEKQQVKPEAVTL